MIYPCFDIICCTETMTGEKLIFKSRLITGDFPVKTSNKQITGRESFCKECWDALPKKEQYESRNYTPAFDPKKYRHMNKESQIKSVGFLNL